MFQINDDFVCLLDECNKKGCFCCDCDECVSVESVLEDSIVSEGAFF